MLTSYTNGVPRVGAWRDKCPGPGRGNLGGGHADTAERRGPAGPPGVRGAAEVEAAGAGLAGAGLAGAGLAGAGLAGAGLAGAGLAGAGLAGWPLFVKMPIGTASAGVRRAGSPDELRQVAADYKRLGAFG